MGKTLWGILLGLLFVLPIQVFAWHQPHRQHGSTQAPTSPVQNPPIVVTPPPVVSTPTACTKAINYGYQSLKNGQYDMDQVASDLAYLKAHGYNCLRLAFYGTNSSITKTLALGAKQQGFYVEIGNDGNPTASSYASGVIAEATWAQANHIDQVSIGNEASKDSTTQSSLVALSCAVKQVYSGVVSYDTYLDPAHDEIKAWAANRGCLDKLGLNIYAGYSRTTAEAQQYLPGHWYVSETNLDCDAGLCADDTSWASGLGNVLSTERAYNVSIFVFSFNAGGDGVSTHWSVMGHPAVMSAIGL